MTGYRLGFSTLGTPGASAEEIIDLADRAGFEAVELRIGDDEPIGTHADATMRRAWRAAFEASDVRMLSINTYLRTSAIDPGTLDRLHSLIGLARDLGAGGVRLFVGDERRIADDLSAGEIRSARLLDSAGSLADRAGVDLLLETHDSHPTAERMLRILRALESPTSRRRVRVIWDAAHSWCAGEEFATTHDALADRLAWVQIKDVRGRVDPTPVPLGSGSFPIGELRQALRDDTMLALEWERRWHPELPALEDALPAMRTWLS